MRIAVVLLMGLSCAPPRPEAPTVSAQPVAGAFTERTTVTLTASAPATIYASTDGSDPRTTATGRLEGASPLKVDLTRTTTLRYFASVAAGDGPLGEGTWERLPSPGSVAGVVMVGAFGVGKSLAVSRGLELLRLGRVSSAGAVPFRFVGVPTGTHRLLAWLDLNGDGQFFLPIDLASPEVSVQVDLGDPTLAAVEGVRLNLASSGPGLGTLRGTITLPNAPLLQTLQVAVLTPGELVGVQPATLLRLLQGGYRVVTTPIDTAYPYVITELQPGEYVPMPSLLGYANGSLAVNALVNPVVNIVAGEETVADFAFGPASISGEVVLPVDGGVSGVTWGVVAARIGSFTSGGQMMVMPIVFPGAMTNAHFAGQAIRANADLGVRAFTNLTSADPLMDALAWSGFLSTDPAQVVVHTSSATTTLTLVLP